MSGINAPRIGAAVAHPGIDPRAWTANGVVTNVIVDGSGYLVEVEVDDETNVLAHVASPYGGNGYGMHCPYVVDDWVAIAYVGSDVQGVRPIVLGTAWDRGDPVSADALAHPGDFLIVVRPGTSCRIVVTGGGNVVIEARDTGVVMLGADGLNPITDGAMNGDAIEFSTGLHQWEIPGQTSSKVLVKP